MATYLKARSATVVPMADQRHVPVNAGEIVDLDQTRDTFKERWESGDPWLESLFEETSDPQGKTADEYYPHEDPVQRSMEEHEELVRARAAMPIEERVGADTRTGVQTDRFRTLPTSGADLTADHRFAAGSADTSEALPDEAGDAEADRESVKPGDRSMPGDKAAVSSAPNAATVGDKEEKGKSKASAKKDDES